jgi:hypothetical protein
MMPAWAPRSIARLSSLAIGPEAAVEDHVPLISAEQGVAICTQRHIRAEAFEEAHLRTPAEFQYFHRKRAARPDFGRQLAFVHHDHLPLADLSDDLLPQQGAGATLDEAKRWVDLVGAIDRNVDLARNVVAEHRDPASVSREVAMPIMSFRSPTHSRSAMRHVAKIAVEPVPSPIVIPD